jgi:hypothetical protein
MKKTRLFFVVLLSLSMSLFLINCGGSGDGSGGGGISYEGETSQVLIDEGNANTVATNAYENGNSMRVMQGAGGIFGAVSDNGNGQITNPYSVTLANFITNFLEQADLSEGTGNPSMAVVSYSESMPGECGGSAAISGTVDDTTGSFNISATFSSFCSYEDGLTGSVTANGTIRMVGSVQEEPFSLQADVTLSQFEFTQSGTGVSASAGGTMSMSIDSTGAIITMSVVMKDETLDKTYKVENLVISMSNMTSSSATFSMSGRFYDPDYGYVDIATTAEFQVDVSGNVPTEGIMVITGASNTKARLVAVDSTTYRVEADTTGDNEYDYNSETLTW